MYSAGVIRGRSRQLPLRHEPVELRQKQAHEKAAVEQPEVKQPRSYPDHLIKGRSIGDISNAPER